LSNLKGTAVVLDFGQRARGQSADSRQQASGNGSVSREERPGSVFKRGKHFAVVNERGPLFDVA